jgi:hypothetical protein
MGMDGENIKGRAYAFGVLSAIKPFQRPVVELVLLALRAAKPDATARDLSFLHFAHWVVLPGERVRETGSNRSARRRSYLLFLSAFNGDWDEYLNAFSRVLFDALNAVWNRCERWPDASRREAFLDYVDAHELFADAFWNAYGDANAEDIRAALRMSDALDRFALETPPPTAADAVQFRRACDRLLLQLCADLAA